MEILGEGCRFGISISIDNGGGLKVARLAERRPNTTWSDYPNGTSGANKRNCRIYFNSWILQDVSRDKCVHGKKRRGTHLCCVFDEATYYMPVFQKFLVSPKIEAVRWNYSF